MSRRYGGKQPAPTLREGVIAALVILAVSFALGYLHGRFL